MMLNFETEERGNTVGIFRPVGELDEQSRKKFSTAYERFVYKVLDKPHEWGTTLMIVDLTKINYLENIILVKVLNKYRFEGELPLVCNQENILESFRSSPLYKIYPIFKEIAAVLKGREKE